MIRLFGTNDFGVENLIEPQAPEGTGQATSLISSVPDEWARQWPAEEIWCANVPIDALGATGQDGWASQRQTARDLASYPKNLHVSCFRVGSANAACSDRSDHR